MEDIPKTLRRLRNESNMTGSQVATRLRDFGINISNITLYGYERGVSNAPANTVMALCSIYGVENALVEFGYIDEKDAHLYENGDLIKNGTGNIFKEPIDNLDVNKEIKDLAKLYATMDETDRKLVRDVTSYLAKKNKNE